MSQASKQIDWCLNKAQREIEECKKQGKRPKHRGLLKTESNLEEAKEHIKKAEHNLQVTEYLKTGNFLDISVSTIFYSMYHCFLAIASKFGYETSNQTCTISLMEYLKETKKINLNDKFIEMFKYKESEKEKENSIIEMREDYTYNTKLSFNEMKIRDLIKLCKELIDTTKEIVLNTKI